MKKVKQPGIGNREPMNKQPGIGTREPMKKTARVGTLGPMTERAMPTEGEQRPRSPRATRGGGGSGDVRAQRVEATRGGNTWRNSASSLEANNALRGELERVCPERVQRNHCRQKGMLSQSEKSIGWKRQRITEKRKSPTSRTS